VHSNATAKLPYQNLNARADPKSNLILKTGVMHMAGRMYKKRQRQRTQPTVNKLENFYTHGRVRL